MRRRGARRPQASRRRASAGLATGLGSLVAAIGLAGCGAPGNALVLYSGQHEATTDAVVAAFERSTGIAVVVRSDDEDVLASELANEGASSPADVVWTENSPALEYLQGVGLLAAVRRTTLAETELRFDSPRGDWIGVSARVSVLVYNPSIVAASQLPTSVLELASPRYAGDVGIAPGETDFQPIVTAVDRALGPSRTVAWLEALARNAGDNVYPDNEGLVAAVNQGLVGMGVINQYYWYRLRDQLGAAGMHSRLAFFAPRDPGYVVDVSGAAAMRFAPHPRWAQEFLSFLAGPIAQSIIANPARSASFEYPIDSGVVSVAGEPPFSSLRPDPVGISELGDGATARGLLIDAGLL